MNQIRDQIIDSLKTAKRNPKLFNRFYRILAASTVFTLIRPGRREVVVAAVIEGESREYISCFSNPFFADRTLRYYAQLPENQGLLARIQPVPALKLFFSAATRGYSVYLNPKNQSEERLLLDPKRVKSFLIGPWALGADAPAANRRQKSDLKRSRTGRELIEDANTLIPIADLDFDHYYTARQLAGIFAVSENEVNRIIAGLVRDEVFDLDSVSVALDNGGDRSEPEALSGARYYDPLVAFLVGPQIENQRGHEFRAFQARLLSEYCQTRQEAATENADLKNQILKLEKANQGLELEIQERDKIIEALNAVPGNMHEAIQRLNQDLIASTREIAELKGDLAAASLWDLPESVLEAKQTAEARYGSKLVFHERVDQSIESFSLKNDLRATHEAVKMFKALAECLYDQKFVRGNFSEERFRDETGLRLSMTESRASKRDSALDETRAYNYKGSTVYAYPHLKDVVQGVQVRLHFQFLEDEKKILICHFGHHLPNAKTRFLN